MAGLFLMFFVMSIPCGFTDPDPLDQINVNINLDEEKSSPARVGADYHTYNIPSNSDQTQCLYGAWTRWTCTGEEEISTRSCNSLNEHRYRNPCHTGTPHCSTTSWSTCNSGIQTRVVCKENLIERHSQSCITAGSQQLIGQRDQDDRQVFQRESQQGTKAKYSKMEDGKLCSGSWSRITTEADCKAGATELNLKWATSWNGNGDFPGCLHANDGRNLVYFNEGPSPSNTANNPKYAAICKSYKVSYVGEMVDDPSSFSRPDQTITSHLHLNLDIDFSGSILTGNVILSMTKSRTDVDITILDANNLLIYNIEDAASGDDLKYNYSNDKLEVSLPPREEVQLKIYYSTSPNSSALMWLSPVQTAGKTHPYVFSQCSAINCRSMLPCQDTPSVKFTYSANITAPKGITVFMSAIREGDPEVLKNGKIRFSFIQKLPIPSYLIFLAAGAVEARKIGPRSHVWSEKKFVDRAVYDFSETEKMLLEAEKMSGPYVWGIFDILVLPPSFPHRGMENPCVTVASPFLLSGDKSNADIIAHEIVHSWTGNLVTNANFEHYWLNEGFTRFLEQKIIGRIHGEPAKHMMALLGWTILTKTVERSLNFTSLVVNLTGTHPDDAFSSVPYEKGSIFLWYLENIVGEKGMENFLRSYYKRFKYKSISSETFKKYFIEYFPPKPSLTEIDWDTWFYAPGMPPYKPPYDTSLAEAAWQLANRWQQWNPRGRLPVVNSSQFHNFSAKQIAEFFETLLTGEPLDINTLEKMEEEYNLNDNGNMEIFFRWIRLGLKAKWEKALPRALKLVTEVGTLVYIGPVYTDLYDWEEKRELAIETFMKNRKNMMSIVWVKVRKVLRLD